MGEFTPIETQEQLNEVIKDRLARERAKYADYDEIKNKCSDFEKQIADLNNQLSGNADKAALYEKAIAEKDAIIKAHNIRDLKIKVAHDSKIGFDAIDFLKGETEEEITASAAALKNLMGNGRPAPARFTPDEHTDTGKTAAYRKIAQSMCGN